MLSQQHPGGKKEILTEGLRDPYLPGGLRNPYLTGGLRDPYFTDGENATASADSDLRL